MTPTVAILLPAMRRRLLTALVANIHEATSESHEILVVGTRKVVAPLLDDPTVEVWTDRGGTFGQRINYLFARSTAPYVFLGADDLKFHRGWFAAAMEPMRRVDGVVMVADLCSDHGTLPLVSRHYIDTLGGTVDSSGLVIHEGYGHMFSERELVEVAQSRGRYAYAPKSVVEHLHWMAGKANRSDPVYQLGESHWDADLVTFTERQGLWKGTQ